MNQEISGQVGIVNEFDRPYERLIAEVRGESCYYIHPSMQDRWKDVPMRLDDFTPLDHFGVLVKIGDGKFSGEHLPEMSSAHYQDGKPRRWQGSSQFSFDYIPHEAPPAQGN